MNILEEGVRKNTRRRLGMDELSMVFTNGLMELACCIFFCAVQSERGGDHISKFVTIESHTKV